MLRTKNSSQIATGTKLSSALLIVAQLVACGPTVEAGGAASNANQQPDGVEASASPCECIASYGGPSMGDDALRLLRDDGLPMCFHQNDPNQLDQERVCLPSIVGQHVIDGRDIEVYYFCSDVCPDYGHVGIRFTGIKDTPSCCAIGGIPLLDPAWGGFEACVPAEIDPQVSWVGKCP